MKTFLLSLTLIVALAFPAHAIEINRNVETAPIADVPPPEDAPPLPKADGKPKPAAPKHLQVAPPKEGEAVKAAVLSEKDKADVQRIEVYLNGLHNISADFLQVDDQGNLMRGAIKIQRPGKMRVDYAPPSKDFIIADGMMVHIWDGTLKSQTNVPQDASLANFILREPIKLAGGVTVTNFQRFPNKLELTLQQTTDPGAGKLTLIFEDKPLLLRQWRVIDTQGRTTGVNLENERADVKFAGDTFNFVAPTFGKSTKSQIPQ